MVCYHDDGNGSSPALHNSCGCCNKIMDRGQTLVPTFLMALVIPAVSHNIVCQTLTLFWLVNNQFKTGYSQELGPVLISLFSTIFKYFVFPWHKCHQCQPESCWSELTTVQISHNRLVGSDTGWQQAELVSLYQVTTLLISLPIICAVKLWGFFKTCLSVTFSGFILTTNDKEMRDNTVYMQLSLI